MTKNSLPLEKIVKLLEQEGAFVIKFSDIDALGEEKALEFKHHEYVLPDRKMYLKAYMSKVNEWVQNNHVVSIDKNKIENIIYDVDFPANLNHLPSELPNDLQKNAYMYMIELYGDLLMEKMKRKGFSDDVIYNMRLVTDEALFNAFKHGNGMDATKKIEYTEEYIRGNFRHGFVVSVKDEGINIIKPENIQAAINYSKNNFSFDDHGRGFIFMKLFGDTALIYPHKSGNFIYLDKFEDLPENLRNNYKLDKVA